MSVNPEMGTRPAHPQLTKAAIDAAEKAVVNLFKGKPAHNIERHLNRADLRRLIAIAFIAGAQWQEGGK